MVNGLRFFNKETQKYSFLGLINALRYTTIFIKLHKVYFQHISLSYLCTFSGCASDKIYFSPMTCNTFSENMRVTNARST